MTQKRIQPSIGLLKSALKFQKFKQIFLIDFRVIFILTAMDSIVWSQFIMAYQMIQSKFTRNSWVRLPHDDSKWKTREFLWFLPPVTLFKNICSSEIKLSTLCICVLHLVHKVRLARCALVHEHPLVIQPR